MLNIIKKDFILQKRYTPLYLLTLILFLWVGWGLEYVIGLMSIMFLVNSHYYDEKDNSNILINSLPYTRKEIVSSKYIVTLLFTVIITPFCIVGSYFINDGMVFQFSLKSLVLSYIVVLIFAALYLPFFYKFKAQYLFFVFIAVSFGIMLLLKNIPYILNKYANDFFIFLTGISDLGIYGTLVVIAVSFYGLSWMLSINIYKNKAY